MALPILAKTITSSLVKKGTDAKKESKKVSTEKLLPGSVGNKVKVSKFKSRTPRPYRKKFEPTKFLPPSKIDENFDMEKLDDLLASLVGNTKDLEKVTKKDVTDEKEKSTQKKNVKEKLKRSKREEETEEKKTVTKVKSIPKFKSPDFLKEILGFTGRLVLATGIMEVLNFLTDPENSNGLIKFLTDHIDKIALGALGMLGAVFLSSFIPVIGMAGTILLMMKPVIGALVGILTNPVVAAALLATGLFTAGYLAPKANPNLVNEQERKVDQAPGTREEKIEALEEQLKNLNWFDRYVRGMGSEIEEQLERLRTGRTKSYGQDFGQAGDPLYKEDMVKPQTEVLPGVKLGGLKGDSGSVAYEGQERASLSTQYSPFAQSDIDEQGMSIISGKGYRRSTDSDHKGFDIPAIEGTPVYAYLPGEITQNRYAPGYGNIVEWKDSKYGQTHMFAHLKEPGPLSVGTKFEAGTMLAKTGDTGTPGSYHLHWEIGAQGSEVDPGEWVKKHPINFSSTPKDQNVNYQTSYETSGTQVAFVKVPTPTPVPMSSGETVESGGFIGGSSSNVNSYENLVLSSHYREA